MGFCDHVFEVFLALGILVSGALADGDVWCRRDAGGCGFPAAGRACGRRGCCGRCSLAGSVALSEMSADFRGPLWTARVDAPTPVHDLTQRRFSRAGFSWRPSRWCRRPLGGSRGSRGGGWRALSGCWLPVGIMEAPAAGAGSVAMRVMGPGEVSDASPGLVEPAESVRGVGANRVGLAAPL